MIILHVQTLIFSIHKLCCVLFFIGALHAKSSNILEIHRIRNLRAKKSTKLDIWQNSIWILDDDFFGISKCQTIQKDFIRFKLGMFSFASL